MSEQPALLCRVGTHTIAIPLALVVETLRPLPIAPLPAMPPFVLGLSVLRGAAVPVIDARTLLGASTREPCRRYVTLALGPRRAALAVDGVIGVHALALSSLEELPPVLGALASDLVAAISTLDASLLLVLRTSRLVPEAAWATGGTS